MPLKMKNLFEKPAGGSADAFRVDAEKHVGLPISKWTEIEKHKMLEWSTGMANKENSRSVFLKKYNTTDIGDLVRKLLRMAGPQPSLSRERGGR